MKTGHSLPDIHNDDITLAFDHLCKTLDAAASAAGVKLCDVAVSWHIADDQNSGFCCLISEGLTPEVAEGMAGVLLMDADEADIEETITAPRRQ